MNLECGCKACHTIVIMCLIIIFTFPTSIFCIIIYSYNILESKWSKIAQINHSKPEHLVGVVLLQNLKLVILCLI